MEPLISVPVPITWPPSYSCAGTTCTVYASPVTTDYYISDFKDQTASAVWNFPYATNDWNTPAYVQFTISKEFTTYSKTAVLYFTADDVAEIYINGMSLLSYQCCEMPVPYTLTEGILKPGSNRLDVMLLNTGGLARFATSLMDEENGDVIVNTDDTWTCME